MKNKKTPYILLFFTFCFLNSSFAQLAEKNLNIYGSYNTGQFLGKDMSDGNSFIFPNLYSNMSELNGYSLKATFKLFSFFSFGLEVGEMTGNNWSLENSDLYKESNVKLQSVSPVFQIHSQFNETGIFNRLIIYGEVAPVFGQSKLHLKLPVFEIRDENGSEIKFMESTDNYFGMKVGTGVYFAFSKAVGFNLSYSIQQSFISSALYNEEKFLFGQLSIGLYFRLFYDKRYVY